MRSLRLVLPSLLLALLLVSAPAPAETPVASGTASLVYCSGSVSVLRAGSRSWKKGAAKSALKAGDQVKTGADGCAVLLLEDQSTLKMNRSTHVLLQKLQPPSNPTTGTRIRLFVGNVWTDVNNFFYGKSTFEIEAGQTSASVKGTAFDMAATETALTVKGWEGTVRLSSAGGAIDVESFDEADVGAGRATKKRFAVGDESFDDWNGWNNYIDGVVHEERARGASQRDGEELAAEIAAAPNPDGFTAEMGALMQAVPEAKEKIMERMMRRVPEGSREALSPRVERRFARCWQDLPPARRSSARKGIEARAGNMKILQRKWKDRHPNAGKPGRGEAPRKPPTMREDRPGAGGKLPAVGRDGPGAGGKPPAVRKNRPGADRKPPTVKKGAQPSGHAGEPGKRKAERPLPAPRKVPRPEEPEK